MTKKRKGQKAGNGAATPANLANLPIAPPVAPPIAKSSSSSSAVSSSKTKDKPLLNPGGLIISRNKHWKYISSFHGPWLQLPPEILEDLADNNYFATPPRPIHPGAFYDLVKIRRLVEEATTLAVRATSGVTSSSLHNSSNANNRLVYNGASSLGLGLGGGGGTARLSKERRFRMRELATQKLSKAYHIDEIAASVATMQSASALEDVANLVLQRKNYDSDALYVHFFHEKIPSRMLVQSLNLAPLDATIAAAPNEAARWRTRAVAKIFKEDFTGAAHDLTEGLSMCRMGFGQHRSANHADAIKAAKFRGNRYKLDEEDQPNALEDQLLFQRAGVYLNAALQAIDEALPPRMLSGMGATVNGTEETDSMNMAAIGANLPAENGTDHSREVARKTVKVNARRALRDYLKFLSGFDYSPGLSSENKNDFLNTINARIKAVREEKERLENYEQLESAPTPESSASSTAGSKEDIEERNPRAGFPPLPLRPVFTISSLFNASQALDLPPYPATELTTKKQYTKSVPETKQAASLLSVAEYDSHEAITYHPLLTDALHSLLLCHCLIQTPSIELNRYAYMVARLARLCDGYPIFLAARSPGRTDWMEVLRRCGNWIGLNATWESLCAPIDIPGHPHVNKEDHMKRCREDAIEEVLSQDREFDTESFAQAVAEIERRRKDTFRVMDGSGVPKRWAAEDREEREYPLNTDRAAVIAMWVRDGLEREDINAKKKKEAERLRTLRKEERRTAKEAIKNENEADPEMKALDDKGQEDKGSASASSRASDLAPDEDSGGVPLPYSFWQ